MKNCVVLSTSILILAGCSEGNLGNLNPLTWFGNDSQTAESSVDSVLVDNSVMVPQVTNLAQFPITNGLIISASGMPNTQGFYNPVLLPLNDEMPMDGYLNYELRASAPKEETNVGTYRSRQLDAALTITEDKLKNIIGIRVIALENSLQIEI